MEITSTSISQTETFARDFLEHLKPNTVGATVIGLYGDLGAGKTAFTKCVAKILGVAEEITSPTFVIQKTYKLNGQKFETLVHIDAYRLEKGEELARLGWAELLKDPKNLILIEWPEKVADVMPQNHQKLYFTFIDEITRKIQVE